MRKLLSNVMAFPAISWKTKAPIVLLLALPVLLLAEGSQDAAPLPGDFVMLFTNNPTFGNFASPGTDPTSRLYVTFCNPDERLYIKLSREYDGFGQPQFTGAYNFQIRNSAGTIVHGPFMINNTTENVSTFAAATFTGAADPAYSGFYTFIPPATGDYYIEFEDSDQANIGLWDFTVADGNGDPKPGRLWSQNWGLRTPQINDALPECEWDRPFNATIYSYTSDGFVSKIDFQNSGFQGLSFNINFTSSGPGNSGDLFMDRKSMIGNTTGNAEHKIFFNPPDPCAFPDGECGFVDFDMQFDCDINGDFCLPVTVSQPGQVDVLLDFNNNQVFDPNSEDVVLIYCFSPGDLSTCIPWDGMKGDGSQVALGDNFNVVINYAQGVQHWAVFDAEFLKNGFCVEVVRPSCLGLSTNKLYWDDELLPDLPGTGQPKQQFAGCDCQTNGCRTWNYFDPMDDDCLNVDDANTVGYGDKNTVNTWWFARLSVAQPVSIPFLVCDITGPAFLCAGGDAQLIVDFPPNVNVTNIDWSGPGGFSSMGDETNTMVTVNIGGTYTVVITDVNGCMTSCSYEIPTQICCPCTEPPTINCPDDVVYDCNPADANMDGIPDAIPDPNQEIADGAVIASNPNMECMVTITHGGDSPPVQNGCMVSITRTYIATNECEDLFTTCTQTFSWIEDNTGPQITCPDPVSVDCIENVPAPDINLVTASDACPGTVTIEHVDDVSDNMACPETITRTYRATDACGNTTDCTQLITIDDDTPPTITCPGPITVDCIENVPAPDINLPVVSDNCNAAVTVTHVGDVSDGMTCPETITRTYRATDACGNTTDCTQLITIDDDTPPTITCPGPITVDCIENVPAPDINLPVVSDNCNATVTVTHVGDVSDGMTCPETITRTYRATDACGNTTDCTQLITIDDDTPPMITCPGPITVDCIANVPAPDINLPVVSDNCNATVTVTHVGDVSDGMTCPETITRTYRATDACGNTTDCTQLITIDDDTPPTITCPAPIMVNCIEDVPAPDVNLPVVSDNCNAAVTVTHLDDMTAGTTCPQVIIRFYRATDPCGNTTDCAQFIVIDDNSAPSISCPGPIAVDCIEDVPAPDINLPVVSDNCDAPVTVTHVGDVPDNMTCPQMITRTYRATDACGNTAECTQIITIDDDTGPTIICPPMLMVDCVEDVPDPDVNLPTVMDNCDAPVTVTHEGDQTFMDCPLWIMRTYRATDACGNTAECNQVIIVFDNIPPTITCPGPIAVDCADDVPAPDINAPVVSDNCSAPVTVTHVGDVSDNMTCPQTITRTYRATDACGNTTDCIQLILVGDDVPPTITCPGPITVDCIEDVPPPNINAVTVSDNCMDGVTVTHVGDVSNNMTCPRTITRTYRATDTCGNSADCTQLITVDDNIPPTITCPGPVVVSCLEDVPPPNIGLPTVTDNCNAQVTVTHVGDVPNNMTCPQTIMRTYRATDACGNSTDCTQMIFVDDNTPPTITCPAPIMLECTDNIPAPNTALVTTSDNCAAPVTVTWLGDASDNMTCPETITRTYLATDACGNTASCTQLIIIDDNTPPTVTCPGPITVDCMDNVPGPNPFLVNASDNCQGSVSVQWLGDFMNGQVCPKQIMRRYRATDSCGNTADCVQLITVDDNTLPTVVCPPSPPAVSGCSPTAIQQVTALPFSSVSAFITLGQFTAEGGMASDNCGIASIRYRDTQSGFCTIIVKRTYTIVDDCGNARTCQQTFVIEDDIAPDWGVNLPDVTLKTSMGASCPNPPMISLNENTLMPIATGTNTVSYTVHGSTFFTPNGNVSDNCTAANDLRTYVWDIQTNYNNLADGCIRQIRVVFRLRDNCGNFQDQDVIYTILDDTAPQITAPAIDTTFACDGLGNVDELNEWLAANGGASATDDCQTVLWSNNFVGLTDDVCGAAGSAMVTFTASDGCGNFSTTIATFSIIDTLPPEGDCPEGLSNLPDLASVPAPDPDAVLANYTDECGDVTVTFLEEIPGDSPCFEFEVIQVFLVEDECGNGLICEVIHTGLPVDTDPLVGTCPQGTFNNECIGRIEAPDPDDVAANYTGTGEVNAAIIDTLVVGDDCSGFMITFVYEVFDECNSTTCEVTFQGQDFKPPYGNCPVGTDTLRCVGDIPDPDPDMIAESFDDPCGEVIVTLEETIDDTDNCWYFSRTYVYAIADSCGNTRFCEVTYSGATQTPSTSILVATDLTCIDQVPEPDPEWIASQFDNGCGDELTASYWTSITNNNFCSGFRVSHFYMVMQECGGMFWASASYMGTNCPGCEGGGNFDNDDPSLNLTPQEEPRVSFPTFDKDSGTNPPGPEEVVMEVYPNPTGGTVNVSLSGFDSDRVQLHVVDVNGVVVYTQKDVDARVPAMLDLDRVGLPSGVYRVMALSDRQVAVQKVVLTK